MKYKLLCMLLLVILLSGCSNKPQVIVYTNTGKVYIEVEIADTEEKRRTGLMFRESLKNNSGMLFVFEEEAYVSFWMKNMKVPLDMLFISSNGTINEIKESVQPCNEDPCPTYPSKYPSKYVLEVNAGFCKSNNINPGNTIQILR